jgi:hypothetical protein
LPFLQSETPPKARLLIPVLGFLFHISEIQYFSGFLRFLRNSFFLHRNSSLCSCFIFGLKTVIRIPAGIPVSYVM